MVHEIRVPASTIRPITLKEAIPLFTQWQIADGMVESTCNNYASNFARMKDALGEGRYLHEMTPQDVTSYMAYYASSSQGTKNNAIGRLKTFLKWARLNRYMSPFEHDNPANAWKPKKYEVAQKPYVGPEEWPRMLDVADNVHPIYRAYVATGLYLMGRGPSELRTLRMSDLHISDGTWSVGITREKTKSATDLMPVAAELQIEWSRWLTWYNQWTRTNLGQELQRDWFLFPAGFYHSWGAEKWPLFPDQMRSKTSIGNISERVLRDFGYPTRNADGTKNRWGGSHAFRRFAARALFDELSATHGYDGALAVVREMLGHKSNRTTEIYLNLSLDRARRDKAITQNQGFMFAQNAPGAVVPLSSRQLPDTLTGAASRTPTAVGALEEATARVLELPLFRATA